MSSPPSNKLFFRNRAAKAVGVAAAAVAIAVFAAVALRGGRGSNQLRQMVSTGSPSFAASETWSVPLKHASASRASQLARPKIDAWRYLPELTNPIAQFETVFWDPKDTESLRREIFDGHISDFQVLEIGCGTGLISLCCLQAGCRSVVATDVNPNAVLNARYNGDVFGFADRLDVRLVSLANRVAFSNIDNGEMFDLIISNPLWEDEKASSIDQFALYDENFLLLDSIVQHASVHLKKRGRLWLVYGAKTPIQRVQSGTARHGWVLEILDHRSLDDLPEVFLPGMLLQLTRAPEGGAK